jgi:signal peptidase I
MQGLTAILLLAFFGYLGAWYLGFVHGEFTLILVIICFVTFLYWLADRFYFLPKRKKSLQVLEAQERIRIENATKMGLVASGAIDEETKEKLLRQPWWLDWTAGLFPVIFVVFIIRSFLFEPFNIPSGSMLPTLWIGDLILVNKFIYGLHVPVLDTPITKGSDPSRGDVIVFHYPPNPSIDYIKRIVGLPGDTISYIDKRLMINGQEVSEKRINDFFNVSQTNYYPQYDEHLGDHFHRILTDMNQPSYFMPIAQFQLYRNNCSYTADGVTCQVPKDYYFVMGDNRDNSEDSRYWGFVPRHNIVGKAVFVWMNFAHPSQIGKIA